MSNSNKRDGCETIYVSKGKEYSSEHLMDVVFAEKVTAENNQSFQT